MQSSGAGGVEYAKMGSQTHINCAKQRARVPFWRQNTALFAKSCAKNGVPLLTEDRRSQRAPLLAQGILIPWERCRPPTPTTSLFFIGQLLRLPRRGRVLGDFDLKSHTGGGNCDSLASRPLQASRLEAGRAFRFRVVIRMRKMKLAK